MRSRGLLEMGIELLDKDGFGLKRRRVSDAFRPHGREVDVLT